MKTRDIVCLQLCILAASQTAFCATRYEAARSGSPREMVLSRADKSPALEAALIAERLSGQPIGTTAVLVGQSRREMDLGVDRTHPLSSGKIRPGAEETMDVGLPFWRLELSPSLVKYLGLTMHQVKAIQRLTDQERPTTEPLIQELRSINGKVHALAQSSAPDEGAVRRLEVVQTRVLKQLMRANSRLQQKINDVLDARQRRKLESLERMNELTIEGGQ